MHSSSEQKQGRPSPSYADVVIANLHAVNIGPFALGHLRAKAAEQSKSTNAAIVMIFVLFIVS